MNELDKIDDAEGLQVDLPGEQWMPSNGSEGMGFIDCWCARCIHDKPSREGVDFDECETEECCEILAASFRGQAREWRQVGEGDPYCAAFTEHQPPDTETRDLFTSTDEYFQRARQRREAGQRAKLAERLKERAKPLLDPEDYGTPHWREE